MDPRVREDDNGAAEQQDTLETTRCRLQSSDDGIPNSSLEAGMIIQQNPSGTVAIKQQDHAELAAFLLEHWSDHNFPKNPQRDDIILATREHDSGWQEFDAAPPIDPQTHLPVDFLTVGGEVAQEIWRKSSGKYLEKNPFVALLITHHAYAINEASHRRDPAWKAFFTELAQLRAELRTQLGMTQNEVESSYSFLRMADWFSLAVCMSHEFGTEKPDKYGGYLSRREADRYLFRPFPFDERELTYELPVYAMRAKGYRSTAEVRPDLKKPSMQQIVLNQLERFAK